MTPRADGGAQVAVAAAREAGAEIAAAFVLPKSVSHKGKVNFYAGWRPYGALGFKLNRAKD